ncbi:2-succinyl-6-hydroxy-2,4-cyclohexadiene-1-carboxylate synthase [Ferrimonas gelatinilytica]|uniref:Putative 2-succinyl-6-hydroxy-2,4-cyclohexadiene-1-carboxylate synthase n=1 Tax=Ferrimonas gelatinilytica TaxID=1255257 RepID=A0ABP9SAV3_9GAMM
MEPAEAPLALTAWGQTDKPALVLLHGFLGSHADWQGVAAALGQHFCCYALDLPGHGASQGVRLTRQPAFDEVNRLLLATLAARKIDRFHLLGYSLGGRLALHLAQHLHQQGQSQRLLSLTLESAHPGLTSEEARQQRLEADGRWHRKMQTEPMVRFLEAWYRQPVFADLAPVQRQRLIAMRKNNDSRCLSALYLGTSLGHQADLRALARYQPLTLITGQKDSKFTELGQDWARQGGAVSHLVLAGGGHNLHAGVPEAFSQAVIDAALS